MGRWKLAEFGEAGRVMLEVGGIDENAVAACVRGILASR